MINKNIAEIVSGNNNLRKSIEKEKECHGHNQHGNVGKSSILTDLNKRLSALKEKDDRLFNNYIQNKNENINLKYIGDKITNLDRKKQVINHSNMNHNQPLIKRDVKIDSGIRTSANSLQQKYISSPNKKVQMGTNPSQASSKVNEIYAKYKK